MDKVSPGSPFRVPPAAIWNGMLGAGEQYTAQQELGDRGGPQLTRPATDRVFLRNDSGGALVRGRVLEIGAKLITTPTPEALWFEGDTPAPDGADTFAITKFPCASTEIVEAQVSGLVLCRLNVNQVQQQWADVDSSSTLLQSKWHGRAKIIWKSTASTGEQDALVQLGHDFRGPILCVATSGLTAGGNASCAVWWAGAAASPASSITVHYNWMDGSGNIGSGKEFFAWWNPSEQKYQPAPAEC